MLTKICFASSNSLRNPNRYHEEDVQGFTLIELLLSLAILIIVMCFSIPFASSLHQKTLLQARQDEIKAAIRYARTQSQLLGKNLILTPILNSNDWSKGMRLFVDNPKHLYTPDTTVIHEWHWNKSSLQITWHGFQSNHYLLFASDNNRNATNGYFSIQMQSGTIVKMVVNRLGRIRIAP